MKIERQIAMVRSVAKNMRQKEKQQAEKEKKTSKMYKILNKVGKAIDEVTKDDITKSEHAFLVDYIKTVMKRPISFYPNLHE